MKSVTGRVNNEGGLQVFSAYLNSEETAFEILAVSDAAFCITVALQIPPARHLFLHSDIIRQVFCRNFAIIQVKK